MLSLVKILNFIGFIAAPILRDCGAGKSLFTINSLSLSPASPNPGDNVLLNLDYTVPQGLTVVGGDATYSITYNFLPLSPTVEPLCQDIPCPLVSGRYVNHSSSVWPTGLSGTLDTKIIWTSEMGAQLLCMSISAKF
jgi:hypothetical protein